VKISISLNNKKYITNTKKSVILKKLRPIKTNYLVGIYKRKNNRHRYPEYDSPVSSITTGIIFISRLIILHPLNITGNLKRRDYLIID